jgi:hypothetical protein
MNTTANNITANNTTANNTAVKMCRKGTACKKTDCTFAHPDGYVPVTINCRFGTKCNKTDCTFAHPDGHVPVKPNCRFGTKCNKNDCTFAHPDGNVIKPVLDVESKRMTDLKNMPNVVNFHGYAPELVTNYGYQMPMPNMIPIPGYAQMPMPNMIPVPGYAQMPMPDMIPVPGYAQMPNMIPVPGYANESVAYSKMQQKKKAHNEFKNSINDNQQKTYQTEHNKTGSPVHGKHPKQRNLNVKPDIEEAITNGHQYQVKQNKDRRAHNTTPNYTIRHNFVENNEESHIPRDNRQKIQQKNTQIVQIEDYDVSYTRPDIIVPNQRHTVNNNCKFQQPPLKTTNDAVCIFIKQGENMYEITNSNMVAFLNDLKNKKFEETEFEGVYKRID